MRVVFFIVFVLVSLISCNTNRNKECFNFDFETVHNNELVGWFDLPGFNNITSIDSTIVKDGKYSMSIDNSIADKDYQIFVFPIYGAYEGAEITLSGYIKTENVSQKGFAGLYMSLDPQISEETMYMEKISGTTDWTEYSISMKYIPSKIFTILVGGILVGDGKMWLDNMNVKIDGKDIAELNPIKSNKRKNVKYEDDNYKNENYNKILDKIDDVTIANLELLARIWGFLKYNHPDIATGSYNWDKELLDFIPSYVEVQDIKERDELLLNWINKYGSIAPIAPLNNIMHNTFLMPDLDWVNNAEISSSLKDKLNEIYNFRCQGFHYYINNSLWGMLGFSNDKSYNNLSCNEVSGRILTLFRYWNIINYFYPYKYLTKTDWNDVLRKYIPIFLNSYENLEFEKSLLLLFGELNDTHVNARGPFNELESTIGDNFAPVQLQYIQNKFVVVGLDKEYIGSSKINYGDVVTHINGKKIDDIIDSVKVYYPSSNDRVMMRDIAPNLLRSNNYYVELDYISNNIKRRGIVNLCHKSKLNIKKTYIKYDKIEPCFLILDNNIGYLNLSNIRSVNLQNTMNELKNTSGLIIDIRDYPAELIAIPLGGYFVNNSTTFEKSSIANINNPGEFYYGKNELIFNARETYEGKVVVLVNEYTQSIAEYTAMAIKAGMNTILIGGRTAGTDGNAATIYLPGGFQTAITTQGVYYPNGEETQCIGLVPDYYVEPTIEGIRDNRDEVLEEAIKIIRKENSISPL